MQEARGTQNLRHLPWEVLSVCRETSKPFMKTFPFWVIYPLTSSVRFRLEFTIRKRKRLRNHLLLKVKHKLNNGLLSKMKKTFLMPKPRWKSFILLKKNRLFKGLQCTSSEWRSPEIRNKMGSICENVSVYLSLMNKHGWSAEFKKNKKPLFLSMCRHSKTMN